MSDKQSEINNDQDNSNKLLNGDTTINNNLSNNNNNDPYIPINNNENENELSYLDDDDPMHVDFNEEQWLSCWPSLYKLHFTCCGRKIHYFGWCSLTGATMFAAFLGIAIGLAIALSPPQTTMVDTIEYIHKNITESNIGNMTIENITNTKIINCEFVIYYSIENETQIEVPDTHLTPYAKAIVEFPITIPLYLLTSTCAAIQGTICVPFGIRWICRQLPEMAQQRFPEADRYQIGGLVGGYIYLRFFNPVVVTPESIHFVDKKVSKTMRRNLILVCRKYEKKLKSSIS